jgi:hypothetical protein
VTWRDALRFTGALLVGIGLGLLPFLQYVARAHHHH